MNLKFRNYLSLKRIIIPCGILVLIFVWNFHIEKKFGFCTQCGRGVYTYRYYLFRSSDYRPKFDRVETLSPTFLYELWNKPECTHGGFATIVDGKLSGPEKGDYLISIETWDVNIIGYGMAGLGWGHSANYHLFAFNWPFYESDRKYLLNRVKADPQFPEKLRHSMQTENPRSNQFVKDLFADMEKVRKN